MDEKRIDELIKKVVGEFQTTIESNDKTAAPKGKNGVFDSIDHAIDAAHTAQVELMALSLEKRAALIAAMKAMALKHADMLGEMAVSETGMGKNPDKAGKVKLVAEKTPGVEDVKPRVYTGDHGMVLEERAPYGVIGSLTPSTNPPSTIINNAISAIAGGNSIVFNPHPAAKGVSLKALQLMNDAIKEAGGPENLLTSINEPTQDTSEILLKNEKIALILATGGEFMVNLVMNSGKKAIVGGPGNPPCIVDETADIPKAALDIVTSSSFDNNVICVLEKEVFAVDSIADSLISNMCKNGAYELKGDDIEKVTSMLIAKDEGAGYRVPVINKKYVGKDAAVILKDAGIEVPATTRIAIMDVPWDHPMVQVEQLLPVLPIVRVKDWKEAKEHALKTEHGYRHTFTMHSTNIDRLSDMAKACNASIFVKNGMSLQGLGYLGEGPTTMTIATPTGEGITTAITFTRIRRCAMVDRFRIV
ncbi:aldehyde dehydrogenase EutE [bacterium]|nr:aldehyde dehydrogenase EutE [bacterium]